MRRNFRHFDEEIIILNIMNVSTMNEKLTCLICLYFQMVVKVLVIVRGVLEVV